jgi:hypothetical protein
MLLTGYYVPSFNNAQGISAFSTTPYFMVKNSWGTWWGEKVSGHTVLSWHAVGVPLSRRTGHASWSCPQLLA